MGENYSFAFEVYRQQRRVNRCRPHLLDAARQATTNAYAPYSKFLVAAAARLDSGEIICGTNQENASYPAGICAERVLLSAIASQHRGAVITTIAISYQNQNGPSEKPISPCGICRQSLLEYEEGNNTAYALYSVHSKGSVQHQQYRLPAAPGIQGRSFKNAIAGKVQNPEGVTQPAMIKEIKPVKKNQNSVCMPCVILNSCWVAISFSISHQNTR